jgi:hypothetical protein
MSMRSRGLRDTPVRGAGAGQRRPALAMTRTAGPAPSVPIVCGSQVRRRSRYCSQTYVVEDPRHLGENTTQRPYCRGDDAERSESWIDWLSVAARLRSLATIERLRGCRSVRSPIAWVALRTVKAYFYDPTGEKARAVKARYQGLCRGCGADTQPRNGKGDAYAYCKACHPGATERRWTCQRVLDAMRAWEGRYGRLPSSYDWSRTHATRRGERRSND